MTISDQQYSCVASQKLLAASRVNVMQGGETRPGERMPEHPDKLLLTLNWLSFCLVISDKQSVAAALHRASQGFTIILTTNVPVTHIQQKYAIELVGAITSFDYAQQSKEDFAKNILNKHMFEGKNSCNCISDLNSLSSQDDRSRADIQCCKFALPLFGTCIAWERIPARGKSTRSHSHR